MEDARVKEVWEEIWSLLEDGKSDEAASAALRAIVEDEEVPELRYLLGISLLDMDEVAAALPELEHAVKLSPDWVDPRSALAWGLFRFCRFDEAREQVARTLDLAPEMAEAHQLDGLLAERDGDDERALIAFAEARRLEPERFTEPYELSEDEFVQIAQDAVKKLDEPVRAVLEDAGFFVQPFPAEELLTSEEPPLDPQLLGLFVGRSLLEQSVQDSGSLPNTLYLFQNNLQRMVRTRADLEEEIRITALHEIGHHLGWDEEDLAERGLA